jgi:2TM family of unknown function (DUF5676)
MKIHGQELALATSVVVAFPDAAMSLTEDTLHLRMENVEWDMTPRSLLIGEFAWAIAAGGAAWGGGALYDRLCKAVS